MQARLKCRYEGSFTSPFCILSLCIAQASWQPSELVKVVMQKREQNVNLDDRGPVAMRQDSSVMRQSAYGPYLVLHGAKVMSTELRVCC